MDVKTLYTFIAVVDHSSFADAAAALGVSASAISVQMRGLEADVQIDLFDRTRRPSTLTPEGYAFAERAREVIAKWEELSETLRRSSNAGVLRLGAVHTAVAGILPPALLELRHTVPELAVRLTTGLTHELEAQLRSGRIDTAVVTEPVTVPATMRFDEVCEERLVVIAHPGAEGGDHREVLARNPYVRFSRKARVAEMIEARLAEEGIAVASQMEVDTLDGVVALVTNGLGVSIVPERVGTAALPETLRLHPLGEPAAVRRMGLLSLKGNARERFCRHLRDALRGQIGAGE
jgi:DNA-binding transcriptional LysR family regulator